MHDGGLGQFGRGEEAGHQHTVGTEHPGRLGHGGNRVGRELQGVHGGDYVEPGGGEPGGGEPGGGEPGGGEPGGGEPGGGEPGGVGARVAEGQVLQVGQAQVGARFGRGGQREHPGNDIDAADAGATLVGQAQHQPGAAADVEQPAAMETTHRVCRSVEHRLEQRPVVRLGITRPGLRIAAPQPLLDQRGR